jgi:hypothetical protein
MFRQYEKTRGDAFADTTGAYPLDRFSMTGRGPRSDKMHVPWSYEYSLCVRQGVPLKFAFLA